jgi:uncharacterized protein (DUF362 family)
MRSALPGIDSYPTRRGFFRGVGLGLAAGIPATWLGLQGWHALQARLAPAPPFTGRSVEIPSPADAMPGPFPGRVVEVRHPGAVGADHRISAEAVRAMVARGLCELTGADHVTEVWRRFFQPGDVVGIKVNPVGRKYNPRQVAAISSPEVILEVVAGLKSAGVRPRDIILFERYAKQFREAGYADLVSTRPLDGVRWHASSVEYDDQQLDIAGYDGGWAREPNVVGYDPDMFVHMGFASSQHDPRDDRRFRSHLSVVVSRMVNKIITIPVLKDHGSAGVTLTLKNLSHGLHNNVARSHLPTFRRAGGESGPNQCNTFIPTAAAQPLIRQKATLHILDGLIGVYEGGPSNGRNWPRKSLFFGTDPVALDHVGWDLIDAKRLREGLPPVARMGMQGNRAEERAREHFDRRQPEHIILAGTIGLGVFDARRIDHRRIDLMG